MWTPKRIVLLAVGFALFVTAYFVYAHFLGGIDGLKPLPEDFGPIANSGDPGPLPPMPVSSAEERLRQAFGPDCDELKRKSKMELGSRGMVLAIENFKIQTDGKVLLTPFSLALFRKEAGDSKFPEINTVQSQEALLTFDKPVTNPADMANRKIVAGELKGDIYVINNRKTAQRDDDVSLFTHGPLYYDEAMHRIWTPNDVRVTDLQSKPKPMTIAGLGMDLDLVNEPETAKPGQPIAAHKKKGSGPSGVSRIRLLQDVEMNLWVEPGFLGSGKGPGDGRSRPAGPTPPGTQVAARPPADPKTAAPASTAKPSATSPPEKSKVVVLTQGPFVYDMRSDVATFDLSHISGPRPNVVTVDRLNEAEGKIDHLACDHLEIQFRHKGAPGGPAAGPAASPAPSDSHAEGLDIETARATGKEVILTSDAEVLEAHGSDFFYDRRTHVSTLKGDPQMWALKEGNEIHAPELQMLDLKGAQTATALGKGYISMFDKSTGKRTLEARWQKRLVYAKEGPVDVLTLVGDACFEDKEKEHAQELRADTLKVWLEAADPGQAKPAGGEQQRRRPQHLEAVGHVRTVSPELRVLDAERLVVWFKDVPAATGQLPGALPPADGRAGGKPADPDGKAPPAEPKDARPGSTAAPAEPAKPKKPIELAARLVVTHVVRTGNKNDLDKLWCEGTVRVRQEPTNPGDKGVDIRGDTLELTHHVDGNVLAVTGDHAQVQMDKVFIVGPQVNIDQTTNETWVHGRGVMRMPSKSNFDGSALASEAELTVHWQKDMLFDGQQADFSGAVRAEQGAGRVACEKMRVVLDRKVSLREGNRGGQTAKVQKLLCLENVWIEDATRRDGRLVSYKRVTSPEVSVDNDNDNGDSQVDASGPGTVRIFQLGTKGEMFPTPSRPVQGAGAAAKPAQPAAKAEEEFKLTHVSFGGAMKGNNKRGTATFYDQVVVVHVPTLNPDLPIDDFRPPKESTRLSCDKLVVLNHKRPDGTSSQEMTAYNKVTIDGPDYSGTANVIKYDESKDQVILEGTAGNPAILEKQDAQGGKRSKIIGLVIIYSPKTGGFKGEQIQTFDFVK